jgi:F-type H+-transporting ATPase subunit b
MQFDWTTFVLELLNFLVLLWLLKHFFYKPVLAVLDARQQRIRDQASQAENTKKEADALKAQYETRLQSWRQEQETARQALEQELAQERARQLEALKKTLADESAKAEARAKAQNAQREAGLVRQASGESYAATAAMLKRLAGPELTERIVEVVAEDLIVLPPQQRAALHDAAAALGPDAKAEIATAHPLNDASLRILTAALQDATGLPLQASARVQPDLIGGVRIALGERLLQANLSAELAFFREGAAGAGHE